MATSNSTQLSGHAKDETGNVYGRLTVVEFAGVHDGIRWSCHCECGNTTIVSGRSLRNGRTKSCGCKHKSVQGLSTSPEYRIWYDLKRRCYDTKKKDYKYYGARGITVCKRWRDSFLAFYEDMGAKPFPKATIERIDNDGNYEPGNCRWATQQEQTQNSRNVRLLTYNGETMGLAAWARKLGIDRCTLRLRLDKGWPLDEVFSSDTSFVARAYRVPPTG